MSLEKGSPTAAHLATDEAAVDGQQAEDDVQLVAAEWWQDGGGKEVLRLEPFTRRGELQLGERELRERSLHLLVRRSGHGGDELARLP